MLADADLDQEVALGTVVLAGCALALHPESLAVVDTRRDVHRERGLVADPPIAAAGATRLGVEGAVAAAAPTGLGLLDPPERCLLDLCGLAAAVTLGTGLGVGALGMARTVTVGAGLGSGDGELLSDALGGLFEFDGEARPEVTTLLWAVPPAAAAATAAEELLEDVAHTTAHVAPHSAERVAAAHPATHATHPASAAPPARPAVEPAAFLGLLEAVVAHLVVGLAFLVVRQDLLGLLRLFELLVGVRVVGDVGVVLGSLLAVGLLDLVLARVARDAEHRVEILAHWLTTLSA
ncbi:putative glutamate dehydrogenase [Halococcus hamelinensis 100A6]|uniref:Putative glutamate dehydrogenase n=1 Tax=Halococcus hamelinensis 100A6 TaxID=1132509 RepID=M0M853_9EURY|nr:putative glutamate dehydrogenase [Halococcus hamelinensis 100A6]